MRLTQCFYDSTVGRSVYSGEITPLPGCPDMVVSHAVYVQGTGGHGKTANAMRIRQLQELGYSAVMCTVCRSNVKQRAILEAEKWSLVWEFPNKRTGNWLAVYMKEL